jgi:hypothetical protein
MLIEIPFNGWSKERLEAEEKNATSRNKKYGEIGDMFDVDFDDFTSKTYILDAVFPLKLKFVGECLYSLEGAESPEEFKQIWCDIHKKIGWTPDKVVWVHLFHEA